MKDNPLVGILSLATTTQNTAQAINHLRQSNRLIQTHPDPSQIIDFSVLVLLKKIIQRFDYQIMRFIVSNYQSVCNFAPKDNPILLIMLANDIYQVSDYVKGTQMSESLESSVKELLICLLQIGTLEAQQREVVQLLLQKKDPVNFKEMIKPIVQEFKHDPLNAVNTLMDLFSSMDTLKEQFYNYATNLGPVISVLESNTNSKVCLRVLTLLDHFIFKTDFNVAVQQFQEEAPISKYTTSETKYITLYEDTFYTSLKLLKIVVSGNTKVTELALIPLERLWKQFPRLTFHLQDLLLNCFKQIAIASNTEPTAAAVKFLFQIMHDPTVEAEFKGKLQHLPVLEPLFNHIMYRDSSELPPDLNVVQQEHLAPVVGYPLTVRVPANQSAYRIIQVLEPNCILCWGFATQEHDISYSLTRVDLPEPLIILSDQRCNASIQPVSIVKLLHSAGLYKLEWDNSYSWFRAKHVRFRLSVLKPFRSPGPRKESYKTIRIITQDQYGQECYTDQDIDVLQIGVYLKKNLMELMALEIKEKVPIENEEDIPLAIMGFIQYLTAGKEVDPVVKIGIIEQNPVYRPRYQQLGAVAIARDAQAIALYSQLQLQAYTLISIVNDQGLRSAVVHKGKLLRGENGHSLGDISLMHNADPAVAVAALLCMLGPAVVVISGEGFGEEAKFEEKVKTMVAENIWNESVIYSSRFAKSIGVESAGKLHYLYYKYKFSL